MTAHKHAEMIKSKADNMELVSLIKKHNGWIVASDSEQDEVIFDSGFEYFLCLPQHKEVCLYWLNGGDVIVRDYPGDERERVLLASGYSNWHDASVFMCERTLIRIKPKKEKRWIGVYKTGATTDACLLREEAKTHPMITDANANGWQFVEIEVDV